MRQGFLCYHAVDNYIILGFDWKLLTDCRKIMWWRLFGGFLGDFFIVLLGVVRCIRFLIQDGMIDWWVLHRHILTFLFLRRLMSWYDCILLCGCCTIRSESLCFVQLLVIILHLDVSLNRDGCFLSRLDRLIGLFWWLDSENLRGSLCIIQRLRRCLALSRSVRFRRLQKLVTVLPQVWSLQGFLNRWGQVVILRIIWNSTSLVAGVPYLWHWINIAVGTIVSWTLSLFLVFGFGF